MLVMMTTSDLDLLKAFASRHSEEAFATLVRRHLNLVYSAALRQVRSLQLAEEVSQSVFSDLAQNAQKLRPGTVLTAWLYQVTRRTAIDVVRREARRQLREQIATEMNAMNATDDDWTHIEPLLDEAMHALDEADRSAVLLRYFENKSLREVGRILGTSEDAAQKRVSRAVERLREFFAKRGVSVGASGLAGVISANAVQAAPAALAVTISTADGIAALGISASTGAGATSGFLGALVQVARTKLVAGLGVAIVGLAIFMLFRARERTGQFAITDASPPTEVQNQRTPGASTQDANAAGVQSEPDPLKLLLAVAQARERISSGSLELNLFVEHALSGRRETNHLQLAAQFDGSKLRSEQVGREYSYTYSADEAEANEIKKRADSMDREAAVQAGLLKPFESHHVMACDGAVLLDYWETDGKASGTTIADSSQGSGGTIFDPRCLGLSTVLSAGSTVENCLGYNGAKSIELAGKEMVERVEAWHVRVRSKFDALLDFWIDVARPTRVLKHANGNNFALSKYDEAKLRDPIPTEVTSMDFRNGSPLMGKRIIRSNSHFNVSIDPASFTLAGLGMAVGTDVIDIRIHRRIGYWTGAGLSEDLPPTKSAEPLSAPNLADLLAQLENAPGSTEAFTAATWIMLNSPDGPEVEKAADVILKEHTRDTNLVSLCQQLERVRHRRSKPLLEAILKDNSSAEVQGIACFALATLLKDEAKYGQNKKATAEAEKCFERVIAKFGRVTQQGRKLEDLARPELSELRRLTIGKPAPEIEGEDLDGQPMRLSEYRGKVVVIVFWWLGNTEALEHRKLFERMAGKPFALVGVYGEDDLTKGKAEIQKYGITWPSFWDKHNGPISKNWNVRGWPDIWVLDSQGVIRYRGVRGRELVEAVETLLPK
jgi:RNA polymerase sigma factor (sigma-70 family)